MMNVMVSVADKNLFDRDRLLEVVERRGIRRLWLFGSAARGTLRDDSDIDAIAEFEAGRSVEADDNYYAASDELEAAFGGRWVDLMIRSERNDSFVDELGQELWLIYDRGELLAEPEDKGIMTEEEKEARALEVDHGRLCHMLSAAKTQRQLAEGVPRERYDGDLRERLAWRELVRVIGEAVYKTRMETLQKVSTDLPWTAIRKTRHIVVHDYYLVKPDVIFDVATTKMTPLIEAVEQYLNREGVDCAKAIEKFTP